MYRTRRVVLLDKSNWKQVKSDGNVWLVEFFAPWCGHCQKLKGPYKELGKAFKDVPGYKIGAVDADAEQSLGSRYGVRGFPTLKIFKDGKATDYNGARDAAGMADALLRAGGADKETKTAVEKALGTKVGGRGGGGGGGGGGGRPKWADNPEIMAILEVPKV